jgi:hypothetical protein
MHNMTTQVLSDGFKVASERNCRYSGSNGGLMTLNYCDVFAFTGKQVLESSAYLISCNYLAEKP